MQGCGGGASGQGNAGPVTTAPVPPETPIALGPTLSSLGSQPLYIAHRGSSALYPEETYLAYDKSVRDGNILLESDAVTIKDGTVALMHDDTVDRTTSATGSVTSFNASAWNALRVDGNTWHGSNYGNDLTIPLFKDWIQKYRSDAIFVPEDKDGNSMAAMLAILDSLKVDRDKVLFQCFSLDPLKLALKAGYQACFLNSNGATSLETVQASGVGCVGLPMSSSIDVKKWTDSGLKVLLWTFNRRFQRNAGLKIGVHGFFSDDPGYLKADKPMYMTDQFALGTWVPGMLGNGNDTSRELRGEFFSGGYWGYSSTKAGYLGCLHGYLCPIRGADDPRVYDIDLKVGFDAVLSNDPTRFASIFLGVDDKPFVDSNEWSAGYNLVLRKNGAIEIYKKTLGANAVLLQTTTSAMIGDAEEVAYRISVTDTTISLTRLNKDGSSGAAATALDSSFKSTYLHLGRNGLACRFSQISVK